MALLLDDDQIEVTREICDLDLTDLDLLIEKLTALNEAQSAACEKDINQWLAIQYGMVRVNSALKGTKYDINQDRELITYRMRRRLGYSVSSNAGSIPEGEFGAFTINLPGWSAPESDEDAESL